jgi:glycosyltransferase involved in cell wall biosynthesis
LKPRLTLVTHVDWGHLWQRPHQLAVALSAHYEVTVVSPVARKRTHLLDNPAPGILLTHVWRMPGSYRSTGVAEANAVLASMQCGPRVRRAAVVVVTSPEVWPWIASSVDERTLVYDCMDDALAFHQDAGVRTLKARWERELLKRSDVVVCSSDELAVRALGRGATRARTIIVPNGWDEQAFPVAASCALPRAGPIELVYFGTIAPWLDFQALRAVATRCPDVSMRLIGPADGRELHDVPGIRIEPPVEHRRLAHAASSAHGFLLPFRVDELTRAVDPVKLYEYIALGKPILSSYWPALDRFSGFVTFYRDADQLVSLVGTREVDKPPGLDRRTAFLAPQSWPARGAELHRAIVRAGG